MSIHDKLSDLIKIKRVAKVNKDRHGWETGRFKEIHKLQPDEKGDVGENYIVWLLEQIGRPARTTPATDPNDKHWDIVVMKKGASIDSTDEKDVEMTIEVKMATLGYRNNSFQHESLEQNRVCDGLIFLDIAPNDIYITAYCKHTFDWKKPHRRRYGIHYKLTLNINKLKEWGSLIKDTNDFKRCYEKLLSEVNAYKSDKKGKYTI